MMERASQTRATSHAPRTGSSGGSHSGRESGLGLSADSGCLIQSEVQTGAEHYCCHSRTARDRASAGTESPDDLEGVSDTTLGADSGRGFLYGRGLDTQGFEAFSGPVLPGSV